MGGVQPGLSGDGGGGTLAHLVQGPIRSGAARERGYRRLAAGSIP